MRAYINESKHDGNELSIITVNCKYCVAIIQICNCTCITTAILPLNMYVITGNTNEFETVTCL